MNEHPLTEQDLRRALQTLVPDDLDVHDFRARVDRLIDSPAPSVDGDLVPLQPAPVTALRHRLARRAGLVATLVACAAAVVALAVAVVPNGHTDRSDRRPTTTGPAVPSDIRNLVFPGTIVLGTYRGLGSKSFAVRQRAVPAYHEYTVYGTCHGSGTLTINQQTLFDVCGAHDGVFGTGGAVVDGRMAVKAGAHTSWRLTLTIAPDARTNGSVQSPINSDLSGPDNGRRQSGHGSQSPTFAGDDTVSVVGTPTYVVSLVCRGTGVTLPDLHGYLANGLSTKTCFPGRMYVWTGVRLTTPATIRVVASPTTTWTIVIDSM